jgi:RNA polymerase sigma factor (sigma-70 family)
MQDEGSSVLDKFRQGDPDAFETLFRMHQHSVYCWILQIVRDAGAAEDITVEAFWRMHQAHARFDSARKFEPWARRIATHAAIDWMRRRRPEDRISPELWNSVEAPSTGDAAVNAEIRMKTKQAFARLPAKLRVTATLVVVEERPQKEVAAALGITVTAVKLRVFRALRLLRKDLSEMGIKP